jgi:hypothetical protein
VIRCGAVFLFAAGCTTYPIIAELDCSMEEEVLAQADTSHLGFSADDAVLWYGDADAVEVTWTGRHSRTPATDTFDVAIGALDGDVVVLRNTPVRNRLTEAECAARDRLVFTRTAAMSSQTGDVTGAGTLQFQLAELAVGSATISGAAPALTLSDTRWLEIEKALADELPPPTTISLWLHSDPTWGEAVSIAAEGPTYTVKVWNCDDQRGECAAWR